MAAAPRTIKDLDAFAAMYAEHRRGVHRTAQRVVGLPAEAEEITQEVFLRLWADPSRYDSSRGEIGTYLRMMAHSRALDRWRQEQAAGRARDRVEQRVRHAEMPTEYQPAAAAERSEAGRIVREALRRLPEDQREALVLTYWGGLSAREISLRCQVPFGTARSRIRLGLEKLRRECGTALAP